MLDALHQQVERMATWPVVALLFIAFFVCVNLFDLRQQKLGRENRTLDGRFSGYSPDEARALFEAIGNSGRRLYAATEITLDLVFPFVYGTLFASLLAHLYTGKHAKYLVLLPLATALVDLMENITLAYLAWSFDGRASSLASVASIFTVVKSCLFAVSLLAILAGALVLIRRSDRLSI